MIPIILFSEISTLNNLTIQLRIPSLTQPHRKSSKISWSKKQVIFRGRMFKIHRLGNLSDRVQQWFRWPIEQVVRLSFSHHWQYINNILLNLYTPHDSQEY